ncbi:MULTISPECIES: GNAT family N-acetyltransferase [unclassified Streptomyces]|uniref:GNAT family N-acetyltransferase n=1 Tax=unclassified Streptomyces TaxID=2593676 RepID=UPI000DB9C672|nr:MULTISPECIES: GNAT family N-acetyltransferase [unclassified Streptomyces]MYT72833.1 GNAT family N-acetyltransferase [Streptomyces sp. SID8367]RAJ78810.1 acetyltransferase (GNAT) family protein [Streptomyces sp. PsTaAH-137]
MTLIVRTLSLDSPSDVDGFTRVRRACVPAMLATPASVAHQAARAHPDAHYRQLIAVTDDGTVIGTAQVGIAHDSPQPGQGYANVYVHPDHENRGAGSLILRTAEDHLARHGAREVFCWAIDGERNLKWAAAHGYKPSRSAHFLRLDLTPDDALPPRGPVPPGVELRTAADYAADPRPLFALDAETAADEPGDIATELADYEQWLAETWHHPLLDHELTSVAVVDGSPAAFTLAHTDGDGRYWSGMTGTARAHRGRGLAKLAKNDSLHRAREAGTTVAYTGNDAGNGPMLAINAWFGYTFDAKEIRHVRTLDA